MPIFAAIYYWFPKMSGRLLSEGLGRVSFVLIFLGILTTFLIQHVMGLDGLPRRVYEYDSVGHLQLYNVISTVGSFILAAGRAGTGPNPVPRPRPTPGAGARPWTA